MITMEAIPALAKEAIPTARLHLNSPHTYFGEPVTTQANADNRNQQLSASVQESYYYINNTHLPITIMRRDGVPITIAPVRSQLSNDFTVRKIITLKGVALQSASKALQVMANEECNEHAVLKTAFKRVDTKIYDEASIMLDYTVTVKDLREKGGWVYHYQLDLVISTKDTLETPPHPYSSRFLNIGSFGSTKTYEDQSELNLKLRYVNHSPTASPKYINLAGKVFLLHPKKDAPFAQISAKIKGKRSELVYQDYLEIFFSANADPSLVDAKGVSHIRVALIEAKETMGLYDTYSEAANPENIELVRKEKLVTAMHDLEILRSQLVRDKTMLEQSDLKLKKELTEAKHALERDQAIFAKNQFELEQKQKELETTRKEQEETFDRERKEYNDRLARIRDEREAASKIEAQHWKDYYEIRSQERKDQSDMIKFIPSILLGLLGVGAALLKLSMPVKTA